MISVQALNVSYAGKRRALEDVTLDIPPHSITAVVGPSGCGKTTLLSCLNRLTDLVPGCEVRGTIKFAGLDVLEQNTDVVDLRRRVGMIFQKPNPFPLNIRRNLEIGLREHGEKDRSKIEATIERALRDVGLWEEVKDRLSSPALGLSGGQQQRLCIARALALEPEALLFDEPCSALDPISSGVVEDLIVSLKKRCTVVVVTHNLAQARRIADQLAFLWPTSGAGRLIERGPAQALFQSPRDELTRAYLSGARG